MYDRFEHTDHREQQYGDDRCAKLPLGSAMPVRRRIRRSGPRIEHVRAFLVELKCFRPSRYCRLQQRYRMRKSRTHLRDSRNLLRDAISAVAIGNLLQLFAKSSCINCHFAFPLPQTSNSSSHLSRGRPPVSPPGYSEYVTPGTGLARRLR
jgi:hypothetical protein